ncbi:Aromatic amino acid aminotransferase I [Wickerhamomyces ciferrii]|uniref:aromatic-amino-acid transaminase n=1 Tax=Wickerhamomyces ciferrii (strain ATCC 14091 / BCRC 22168 / CBS 111 / JCM 3599 / NBRC 0793 / NRRL Y-1031 F-60-10) TaxID=1206466 RepID=K0L0W0_WICCF|nr:Aromatic amino acid aminotransferase I [Wickerhamomyces ciferrii]CCH47088.1 Aromatic amino acid aminotransferase I [Wickerhamomyces ciferrii]
MAGPKDLTHLLSEEALARRPSPLKTAFKYFADPNVVFLGGGLPLADYFPWNKITAESPNPPFRNGIAAVPQSVEEATQTVLAKHSSDNGHHQDIPLSRSLQYGFTEGQAELLDFIKEHTKLVHNVPYEGWDIITSIGNTQSWDATLRTFTSKGDTILVEEFSFSSALETANALGVTQFPVPMDDFGIIPEKLEDVLTNWVGPKPKLLYTIATGQNPTGSSLSSERRAAIYKLAQEHDFIIVEDEPYYYLQMDTYTTDKSAREGKAVHTHKEFLNALVTSFISLDVDGRVIRLDSFSKVLAPGSRVGWIVGQKPILERYIRLHEVSMQTPSGFAQSIINGTLQRWGQDGYLDWLIGLRQEYTHKRDVAIDAVSAHFPKEVSHYIAPVAGMFFTVQFDASKHPKFEEFGKDPLKVENALYEEGLQEGALLIPGSWFKAQGQTNPPQKEQTVPGSENTIFFRGTYAAVPLDKLVVGIERFGKAVTKSFGLN